MLNAIVRMGAFGLLAFGLLEYIGLIPNFFPQEWHSTAIPTALYIFALGTILVSTRKMPVLVSALGIFFIFISIFTLSIEFVT